MDIKAGDQVYLINATPPPGIIASEDNRKLAIHDKWILEVASVNGYILYLHYKGKQTFVVWKSDVVLVEDNDDHLLNQLLRGR